MKGVSYRATHFYRTTPRLKSTIYIVEIEILEVQEKLPLFSHVPSVSMENKKYG